MTRITDTKCKLGLADVEREARAVQALAEQIWGFVDGLDLVPLA